MNLKKIAFIICGATFGSVSAQLAGLFESAAMEKITQATSSFASLELPGGDQLKARAEQAIASGVSAATSALVSSAPGAASASNGKSICGQAISVYDGDTLTMTTQAGAKQRVRLAQIDAPEKKQAYGETSASALAQLVLRETICIKPAGKSGEFEQSYDRKVAWVERLRDGLQVNRAMVASGNAYVGEKRYLTDYSLLRDQEAAKSAAAGLWALPASQRTLPHEWRKAHSNQ